MVNTQLLDDKIEKSGLKINFLSSTLGISRQALSKKMNNITPFRCAEVYVLCDLLKIDNEEEKKKIFLA